MLVAFVIACRTFESSMFVFWPLAPALSRTSRRLLNQQETLSLRVLHHFLPYAVWCVLERVVSAASMDRLPQAQLECS